MPRRRARAFRWMLTVATLALAAADVRAQDRTIPHQLQPATRAAIERVVDSARAAGLPVDPLFSKAQEGVLKSAPEDRIVQAVRRLSLDLAEARAALGETASPAEITAGANALRAGISPSALRRFREMRAPAEGRADRPLTVALVVLADLATRGVPPAQAAASVGELVSRRVPDDALISFRQTVESDLLAGRPPASSLDARMRATIDRMEPRKP